jgi:phosphatidylserine decarboxylase
MASRIPVASEGWPFIVIPAAIAAGLVLTGRRRLAVPFAGAALASLGFFRDPERRIPWIPGSVLSPADGRVRSVDEAIDDFVGPAVRVSIFLSPVDVHVNRAPIAGRVVATRYRPGKFVPAYKADAGEVNECMTIHLQGDRARVTVMQIAGVVARRIVCRVTEEDKVEAGQRIGMIRFGSRTDCYMPHGTVVRVEPGEKVVGGMTVIGELP